MTKIPGRAEYLSKDEIGKMRLIEDRIYNYSDYTIRNIKDLKPYYDELLLEKIGIHNEKSYPERKTYVIGPSGSGKTFFVRKILEKTNFPYEYLKFDKERLKFKRFRKPGEYTKSVLFVNKVHKDAVTFSIIDIFDNYATENECGVDITGYKSFIVCDPDWEHRRFDDYIIDPNSSPFYKIPKHFIPKLLIIDDFNYPIQIAKLEELEGYKGRTKEVAEELIELYKDFEEKAEVEENGYILILSTEHITSLASYISDKKSREEFLRTFEWAETPDEGKNIRNNYKYFREYASKPILFLDINEQYIQNMAEEMNIKDIPPIIPSYERFNENGIFQIKFYPNDLDIVFPEKTIRKSIRGKPVFYKSFKKKGNSYSIERKHSKKIPYVEPLTTLRNLSIIRENVPEISIDSLKELGAVLNGISKREQGNVIYTFREIEKIKREIEIISTELTSGIYFLDLIKEISNGDNKEDLEKAFLKYDISKQ